MWRETLALLDPEAGTETGPWRPETTGPGGSHPEVRTTWDSGHCLSTHPEDGMVQSQTSRCSNLDNKIQLGE